ncbi:MAG: dodecin [Steroidobacteraceae bacterium]
MMPNTYKTVEIIGSSKDGVDDAMRQAVAKASQSLHNLEWIEVMSVRGHIQNNQIAHFQVTMKIGFRID